MYVAHGLRSQTLTMAPTLSNKTRVEGRQVSRRDVLEREAPEVRQHIRGDNGLVLIDRRGPKPDTEPEEPILQILTQRDLGRGHIEPTLPTADEINTSALRVSFPRPAAIRPRMPLAAPLARCGLALLKDHVPAFALLGHAELYTALKDGCYLGKGDAHRPWSPTPKKIADVEGSMKSITFLAETTEPGDWIGDPENAPAAGQVLISVKNGNLLIPSRKLTAHDPGLFNMVQVPFAYDPEAATPA